MSKKVIFGVIALVAVGAAGYYFYRKRKYKTVESGSITYHVKQDTTDEVQQD